MPTSPLPAANRPPTAACRPGDLSRILQRVVGFYAKTLHKDVAGLEYLKARRLDDPSLLEVFQVGYCNGSLMGMLPKAGDIMKSMKALGVLSEEGEECLRGCVTVPLFDSVGNLSGLYGRSIGGERLQDRYLASSAGCIWNGMAAKGQPSLFVTGSILDGMALWQAGFRNVIAIDDSDSLTEQACQLLKDSGTSELFLCLGKDAVGRTAAQRLEGFGTNHPLKAVHQVHWPEDVKDAVGFFMSHEPQEFERLLPDCKGQTPPAEQNGCKAEQNLVGGEGLMAVFGSRRYEVWGIEKPGASHLKATIQAIGREEAPGGSSRFVVDTVNLYLSRSRRGFVSETARLFKEPVDVVEGDLNRLIERMESYVQKRQEQSRSSAVVHVSDADKAEGLKLGRHPDLMGELLRDMDRVGIVGEAANKLIAYLVMSSRKLAEPLALLILSGSGAGKSHLQDTVLLFCPEEDLVKLTSLTDRALFYKEQDSLRHKVLAVEERAGVQRADYAIRNLISARKLVIETTVKNPLTGQLTTQLNTVNGPTAVFQTTTQPELDAETRSRFIVTSIDETPEQTRAILAAQRNRHTLEGLRCRKRREAIIARHHAFQRLLKPLTVINPYESLLSYTEQQLAVRRDNPKYLNLILAVSFLYQMQRPVKYDPELGDYIETSLDDMAIANDLAVGLFGQSLDDLSAPGRRLLALVLDYVQEQAFEHTTTTDKITFSRRELRERLRWSEYQLRTHLQELARLEYVWPLAGRQGQPFRYRLLYDGQGQGGQRFLVGLKSVEQLRREARHLGLEVSGQTASSTCQLRGENQCLEGSSLRVTNEAKSAQQAGESTAWSAPTSDSRHSAGEPIREVRTRSRHTRKQ